MSGSMGEKLIDWNDGVSLILIKIESKMVYTLDQKI